MAGAKVTAKASESSELARTMRSWEEKETQKLELARKNQDKYRFKTCFTYWEHMILNNKAGRLSIAQRQAYERILLIKKWKREHVDANYEDCPFPVLPPV